MVPESMAAMMEAVNAKITVVPIKGKSTSLTFFSFAYLMIVNTVVAAVKTGTPNRPA